MSHPPQTRKNRAKWCEEFLGAFVMLAVGGALSTLFVFELVTRGNVGFVGVLEVLGILFFAGFGFVGVWFLGMIAMDLIGGTVSVSGLVTKTEMVQIGDGNYSDSRETPAIWVDCQKYDVDGKIYEWINEGDELVMAVWPRTGNVRQVTKLAIDSSQLETG